MHNEYARMTHGGKRSSSRNLLHPRLCNRSCNAAALQACTQNTAPWKRRGFRLWETAPRGAALLDCTC